MSMNSDNGQPPVQPLDGPTLRAVRETVGVPLRRIARMAGMSHGHLSKVERGEHGRPVTPAIMNAYEKVTGVKLADAAATVAENKHRQTGRGGKTWTPGTLTHTRRTAYNAAIGALAVGGFLGEPVSRLIDSTGRAFTPIAPDELDFAQLEQLNGLLTDLDLRYGGGLVAQIGKNLLRWAVPMLNLVDLGQADSRRLHAVIGAIAHRTGWAAYDVTSHEAARSLFRLALYTSVIAADHDLRAHVLADVAAQHNQLGYHHDALDLVRLVEGDDRVCAAVRMVLHGVKARTFGCLGQADPCRRQVELAETAFEQASPDQPGWVGRLANPAKLHAITGHALADLAGHTGAQPDREEAIQRLTKAVDQFDSTVHARAHALCVARAGAILVASGNPDQTEELTEWMRERLPRGQRIRSGRLGVGEATDIEEEQEEPDKTRAAVPSPNGGAEK